MIEINNPYKDIYVSAELFMKYLTQKSFQYEKTFHEYGREYDFGVEAGVDSAISHIKYLIGEGKIMMPNKLENRDVRC